MKKHFTGPIWKEPNSIELKSEILAACAGNTLMAQMLQVRGIQTVEQMGAFIDPALYSPVSPSTMDDMDKTVARLCRAIDKKEKIAVWGDFDVDGQTSTAILVDTLRSLGGDVIYHIPLRSKEGHGINISGLENMLAQGAQVILTCDTGISAHSEAAFLKAKGVDLLISDHHSLPEQLPEAFAVVNPQRLPAEHPLRFLAGVGVAYKIAEAMCLQFNRLDLAHAQLDLVALGTIADLAILKADNRYLTQRGLALLRTSRRLGLQAIYERAELNPLNLSEEHVSFILAPRLNAVGRLADANPVVEFLMTSDSSFAAVFSTQMEGLNSERKFLTDQVFKGAMAQVNIQPELLEYPILVLTHPEWPAGVVGITASRMVELFQRPAILLSAPPGQPARGSARSVEGVDITSAIADCQDILLGYGGHPMAAGLSILQENIPAFRRRINQYITNHPEFIKPEKQLQIDAYLNFDQLSEPLIAELEKLAPYGPGNPAPVLAVRDVHVVASQAVGKTKEHLQVMVEDENGASFPFVWWQGADGLIPEGSFDLAYNARLSDYRGQISLSLEWLSVRPRDESPIVLTPEKTSPIIIDLRTIRDAAHEVNAHVKGTDSVIWCEGLSSTCVQGSNRFTLKLAQTLVIWTIPPGPVEVQEALKTVQPERVVLCAVNQGKDDASSFIKELAGQLRYISRQTDGWIDTRELAATLNHRSITIELGIDWLVARGFIKILQKDLPGIRISEGGQKDDDKIMKIEIQLRSVLKETSAYRAYYLRADPASVITSIGK